MPGATQEKTGATQEKSRSSSVLDCNNAPTIRVCACFHGHYSMRAWFSKAWMTSRCSVHDFASLNLPAYGRQAIGTLEKGACLPGLPKKTLPHYPKKQLNLSGKSLFINAPTSLCGTGRERRRTGLLGRVFLLCNPQRPTCQMRGNLKIATPGLWLFI